MDERMRQEIEDAVADATTTPVLAEWERVALVAEIMRIVGDWSPLPPLPDGCEAVYLPTTYVDRVAAQPDGWTQTLADACREAVARRPKPEPRTELVSWWEAAGRRFPDGALIDRVQFCHTDPGPFAYAEGSEFSGKWASADGKVEVLVEDGDR